MDLPSTTIAIQRRTQDREGARRHAVRPDRPQASSRCHPASTGQPARIRGQRRSFLRAARTACQMSVSPTRASPDRRTPGSYPVAEGLQAIRATGYGPAGCWRRARSPASMTRTPPRGAVTGQHERHGPGTSRFQHSALGAPLPRYGRRTARQAKWQRTKIPTPHVPHNPRQHRADAIAVTHLRCSEAKLASSRDRTRTYNLPVNRRPVMAGKRPGLSAASARAACIKACQG